jgi:hypothetical protein
MIDFIIEIKQRLINLCQLPHFLLSHPLLCLNHLLFLSLHNHHLRLVCIGAHLSLQVVKHCEGLRRVHQAVVRVRAFFLQLLLKGLEC